MNSETIIPQTESTIFEDLYKRVALISAARYEASKRMKFHSWCSQWTLAVLAILQIVIATLVSYDLIVISYAEGYKSFVGVILAVIVLSYSLLLGMGDFSARSVQFHNSGVELGELAKEIEYAKSLGTVGEHRYRDYIKRYYQAIGKFENHHNYDYLVAKRSHSEQSCKRPPSWKIWLYNCFFFGHYFLTSLVVSSWIYVAIDVSTEA